METVRIILELILGCSTLLGFILYGKANRRIKDAEAQEAMAKAEKTGAEADEAANEAEGHRFDNLLKLVDSLTSRLSSLNATVDKSDIYRSSSEDRTVKPLTFPPAAAPIRISTAPPNNSWYAVIVTGFSRSEIILSVTLLIP